jgi:hypothetical protein
MDREEYESTIGPTDGNSFFVDKPYATADEFKSILRHRVPRSVLTETGEFLRLAGLRYVEGVVLWIGETIDQNARVNRVAIPQQIASRWHFEVPLEERVRIALSLRQGEQVLAQIHTHETLAFHSLTDDRKAIIDRQWALSVVVPDFCCDGLNDLQRTAVFALRGPLDWIQFTPEQINALFIFN